MCDGLTEAMSGDQASLHLSAAVSAVAVATTPVGLPPRAEPTTGLDILWATARQAIAPRVGLDSHPKRLLRYNGLVDSNEKAPNAAVYHGGCAHGLPVTALGLPVSSPPVPECTTCS